MLKAALNRLSLCIVLIVMVFSTTLAQNQGFIVIENGGSNSPIWVYAYDYDDSEMTSPCADKWLVPGRRWYIGTEGYDSECANYSRLTVVVDPRGINTEPSYGYRHGYVYEVSRPGIVYCTRGGGSVRDVYCEALVN